MAAFEPFAKIKQVSEDPRTAARTIITWGQCNAWPTNVPLGEQPDLKEAPRRTINALVTPADWLEAMGRSEDPT